MVFATCASSFRESLSRLVREPADAEANSLQADTAGIDVVRSSHVAVSVEAYRKRYMDYPGATNYPQLSLANIADTFGQAFLL